MREALLFLATWTGPVCSIAMLVPIVWRPIADRGVSGLSPASAIATAVAVQLWLTYGLLVGDPRQIGVNVPVMIVRLAIMVAAVMASRDARTRALAVGSVVAAVLLALAGRPAVGLAATTLSTVNRTPQAVYTVRRGRGAGLSVAGFALGMVADLAWMTYGIVFGDAFVFGASLICACFDALIVLAAARPDHALIVAARRRLAAEPPAVTYGVVAGD